MPYRAVPVVIFSLATAAAPAAQDPPAPVRIYDGPRSQTKTYMHRFVDSPDGNRYAFRYFPGEDQPTGRRDSARPCEIWICNSELTGHHKAFASPKGESGHGSDVIAWVTNDLVYYAGIAYRVGARKVLWRFAGTGATLPLARSEPVGPHKLYVGIRRDPEKKGWYWLDPSSPARPPLHLVSDMKTLVAHYDGSWAHAEATYIYQNPGDTKVYVVVYDRRRRAEYAFVLNTDGTVHRFLGRSRAGYCANGHVVWYDDESLLAGNQRPGRFDLRGRLIERPAPRGNHLSLSPDRRWWAADIRADKEVRLYRYGSDAYTVINGDVAYFGDFHPSFSRDGRYVFFAGKRPGEPHPGVYRVDVSGCTGAGHAADHSARSGAADNRKAGPGQ